MSVVDDVRRALRPLHPLVHAVLPGPFAAYEDGLVLAGTPVTLQLNTDDPESHRNEIQRLLREAGLMGLRLTLKSNPLQT
jgi:hypothetical protein